MSAVFVERITDRVNVRLDLPILDESQEAAVIGFIAHQAARLIPESMIRFFEDASDGLDAEEAERYTTLLAHFVNSKIDVPWVPEAVEFQVIKQIVDALFVYVAKGAAL